MMNRAEQLRRLKALAGKPAAQSRPWYRIVNLDDDGPARVDVYDEIGGSWFSDGVTASGFVAQLAAIPSSRALEVHINSPGGDVFDGISIYNSIAQRQGPVTTVVDGLAASAASFIAQAGKTRVVSPGSMMMIHDASGICIGDAADMREVADLLDQVSGNLADIYAAHTGKPAGGWRDAMQAETWYKAAEAVDAGLADRLLERPAPEGAAASFDLSMFARVPAWVRAADGGGPPCKTCGGSGRLKHPGTGKNGMKCPGCDGTGTYDPDAEPEEPDEGEAAARAQRSPVLGIESMPLADKALPVHHTATVDEAWDGPAAVAAMPNDDTVLEYCHAWQSDEAAATPHREDDDDADDQKGNYKFPHHKTKGGPANVNACNNGLARLSGADIPDGDRAGVEAHLRAHLKDAGHGDEDADDHAHTSIFAAGAAERFRAALPALKGARA
jgi:ATP-dependent Clp endopeptidase proteolytic subunit ClpP